MIWNRINQGAFDKDIACELNVSPKKVNRPLKHGIKRDQLVLQPVPGGIVSGLEVQPVLSEQAFQ